MGKTSLENTGYQIIDNFIQPNECDEFLEIIAQYRENHELKEIYRPVKRRSLRYQVIDGEQIKEGLGKIWDFYNSRIYDLISGLVSIDLAPLANTRVGVNINVMQPGKSEYRWHYDRTRLTAMLYLNHVEGGETEIYPNYRILLENNSHTRRQRVLDSFLQIGPIRALFGKKMVISPRAGRVAIILGNRCWHSVRSVTGADERINIISAFDIPGSEFPMEKGLDSYLYSQADSDSADPNYS
ncbi:MAG: 2OG-Fe(II) oxygenase [Chloroflexi bacterium]|nr:2OG-Fe(II) oxygenase [Chloroflexota bacterium]